MLKKGQRPSVCEAAASSGQHPDDYRHAQGCPLDEARAEIAQLGKVNGVLNSQVMRQAEEIDELKAEIADWLNRCSMG